MPFRLIFLLSFLNCYLICSCLQAQQTGSQPANAILLQQAKDAMAQEEFETANQYFRQMLNSGQPLSADMCYYFASTLYQLDQYANSQAFNEKYQKLTAGKGALHEESQALEAALQEKFALIQDCDQCNTLGYVMKLCSDCQGEGHQYQNCRTCLGVGKLQCRECKGEGIAITEDYFGNKHYASCTVCGGSGKANCNLCEGKGRLRQDCARCEGSGMAATTLLCQHSTSSIN